MPSLKWVGPMMLHTPTSAGPLFLLGAAALLHPAGSEGATAQSRDCEGLQLQ